jgi:hypothetical protein
MESRGATYEEALKEAQKLGYAEFNPTADVEGFDSTYKLSILSSLAFNTKISYENIYREGITNIDKEDIVQGKKMGYTLKLLGIGKNTGNGIEVRVHPTFVKNDNLLASVNDSFNAVLLEGDSVGEVMLYGRGAGALPTGSAIVSDVIFAARHPMNYFACFDNTIKGAEKTKFVSDFNSVMISSGLISFLNSCSESASVESESKISFLRATPSNPFLRLLINSITPKIISYIEVFTKASASAEVSMVTTLSSSFIERTVFPFRA